MTFNKHMIAVYGDFTCFLHWQYPDFFLHFQPDHGRKVNCSYSCITCMIAVLLFSCFDSSSLYFLNVILFKHEVLKYVLYFGRFKYRDTSFKKECTNIQITDACIHLVVWTLCVPTKKRIFPIYACDSFVK